MKLLIHTALCLALLPMGVKAIDTKEMAAGNGFTENKGQVTDQHGAVRRDIDYKLTAAGGLTIYAGSGQLHYQWAAPATKGQHTTYRMDVVLEGANRQAAVTTEGLLPGAEHYYLPQCPNGITVQSYRKITYHDVYPNIDWVLYTTQGAAQVKYDFVVRPGGHPADIRLRYEGATSLKLADGGIVATTPMGSITEAAPYSYYRGGAAVSSAFVLRDKVLAFDVAAAEGQTLVIDPALTWATYYGGSGGTDSRTVRTDAGGYVYIAGQTISTGNIATSGSHQATIGGGIDAFIAKFNSAGVRQWATYYGGSGNDGAGTLAISGYDNIYVGVGTTTASGLATTGAYLTTMPGVSSSVLLKLNSAGVRQWATYYDGIAFMASDTADNVYGCTGGRDLFKFSAGGALSWVNTTYNTSAGFTIINAIGTDRAGNLYVGGHTWETTGIATTGAFQTSIVTAVQNGFIVKLNSSGTRQWGTYYEAGVDIRALACDAVGNLYAGGTASAPRTGLATTGAYQTAMMGINDGIVAKFTPGGSRLWGSYYGGNGQETIEDMAVNSKGNIYFAGLTFNGTNGVASADGYMTSALTPSSNYWAGLTADGSRRVYGTYYISSNFPSIAVGNDKIYYGGTTNHTGFATAGAHQTTLNGSNDAILAQFSEDTMIYIREPLPSTLACVGDSLKVHFGTSYPLRSGNVFTVHLSNASGSFASPTLLGTITAQTGSTITWPVPSTITPGTGYRVRISSSAPIDTAYQQQNITMGPKPSVTAGGNNVLCTGNTLNLSAASSLTGVNWAWTGPLSFNASVASPSIANVDLNRSGDYIVTATTALGCTGRDTVNVTVNQTPELTSATSNSPVCANGNIELNATGNTPGTVWSWSGPGGFTAAVQDTTLVSVPVSAGGTYTVTATLGSCSTKIDVPVTVVSGPTVAIYPSPNDSICTGTSVTFVAVPTNPGAAPQYQWMLNNNPVTGATGTRYTTTSIATGDEVKVVLTPGAGAACATVVNSNAIPVTVLPYLAPSVSMTATDDNAWPGLQVDFVATATDAGSAPKYQWKLNNVNVQGATSNKWGSAALNNGDSVCIEVTSSYLCPQPKTAVACKRVKIATGIGNVDAASGIRIYPNPASDKLVIEGAGKGTVITITDITGREVYSTTASESNALVTTAALVPGNYLLQLQTAAGKRYRQKIVVSR